MELNVCAFTCNPNFVRSQVLHALCGSLGIVCDLLKAI